MEGQAGMSCMRYEQLKDKEYGQGIGLFVLAVAIILILFFM